MMTTIPMLSTSMAIILMRLNTILTDNLFHINCISDSEEGDTKEQQSDIHCELVFLSD